MLKELAKVLTTHQAQTAFTLWVNIPDPPLAHTEPPRILTLTWAESLVANRFFSHNKGLSSCHVLCMILADTKSCRDTSSLLKTHLLLFYVKICTTSPARLSSRTATVFDCIASVPLTGDSKLVLYADDVLLCHSDDYIELQTDINAIHQCVRKCHLTLNPSKCKVLIASKKGLHSIQLYHYYWMAGPWNKSATTATWELWLPANLVWPHWANLHQGSKFSWYGV